MAEVTIRRANIWDCARIAEVDKVCFDPPWGWDMYFDEILWRWQGYYLIAEDEGKPVGFCGLRITRKEAHITRICVLSEYRGQHIADRFLAMSIEEGERRKKKLFTLEVRESNEPAQALYRKYGFFEKGRTERYYSDEDAITMWRCEESDEERKDDNTCN